MSYLGGDMPVFQINFSRPAGQIAAQYYDFVRLGREGYRRVHMASYETGRYLAERDRPAGPVRAVCDSDPLTGIPSVAWKLVEGADPGYTLYDLADRLRLRGWQVPAYPLTGSLSDVAVQRILVRQGVSRDLAGILLDDIAKRHRPLHQAPDLGLDDARGGVRVQPPLTNLAERSIWSRRFSISEGGLKG